MRKPIKKFVFYGFTPTKNAYIIGIHLILIYRHHISEIIINNYYLIVDCRFLDNYKLFNVARGIVAAILIYSTLTNNTIIHNRYL